MSKVKQRTVFFLASNPQIRNSVKRSLSHITNCHTRRFNNTKLCLNRIIKEDCSLLIIDISKPEINGFELLKKVKMIRPQVDVILVTSKGDMPTAVEAIKAGATDYIVNPDKTYFLPLVKSILKTSPPEFDSDLKLLTKAERLILRQVGEGKTNKEIAQTMGRSVRTIENHRYRLMNKLKVRNAIELMKKAINMGLTSA